MSPTYYQSPGWFWDEPFFTGGSDGTARKGNQILKDARSMDGQLTFRENWGAAHFRVANFVFADGSVRTLSFDLEATQVRALMTPSGDEIVVLPE